MTPTKITLEIIPSPAHFIKYGAKTAQLRVTASDAKNGSYVIESCPLVTGKALPAMRKQAVRFAKSWNISFIDQSLEA